jgi:hypothetical protein
MFWTTRTGNKIALPEMTDGHLYNAISLLRRLNSRWATEKLQTLLSELARRQGKVRETMSIRTPTSARTEVYDEKIQTQGRMHPTDYPKVFLRIVTIKNPKRLITVLTTVRISANRHNPHYNPERHNKYGDVQRVLEESSHNRVTKQMIAEQHQRWINNWDTYKAEARAHYKRKAAQRNRRTAVPVVEETPPPVIQMRTTVPTRFSWRGHDAVEVNWGRPSTPVPEAFQAQLIQQAASQVNADLLWNFAQSMLGPDAQAGQVTVNTATGEETSTELSPQEVYNGMALILNRRTP